MRYCLETPVIKSDLQRSFIFIFNFLVTRVALILLSLFHSIKHRVHDDISKVLSLPCPRSNFVHFIVIKKSFIMLLFKVILGKYSKAISICIVCSDKVHFRKTTVISRSVLMKLVRVIMLDKKNNCIHYTKQHSTNSFHKIQFLYFLHENEI